MVKDADGSRRSPIGSGVAAAAAMRRPAPAPILLRAAAIAASIAASCRGADPPRIVYPLISLDANLARTVQPAIDAWGRPRVAELPVLLMRSVAVPPGYAGDVAYAEAMVEVPRLVAAVGPQSSRATLLVAPIYAERGIPLISATATSDRVAALGPWVFQLAPGDSAEGAFMVGFALDRLKARRVTIFYLDADEYGLGLRDGAVRALRLRGVAPADQVGIIPQADLPRRVAESLRRATPDVVIVAARSPETLAIARAVHARLPGAQLVVGDGVPLNADFARSAGAAAAVVYAVAWWSPDLPDAASRAFAAAFQRVSGARPSAAEAMYYDAIMLAAEAVREAGPRRSAVRRWLSELGTLRPPYRGVTGPIAFGTDRPVNLLMTHVVDGAVAVVGDREAGR
jgi:ABC-type branched-subunit amino acid transport system substrate-binding protein